MEARVIFSKVSTVAYACCSLGFKGIDGLLRAAILVLSLFAAFQLLLHALYNLHLNMDRWLSDTACLSSLVQKRT